MVRNQIVDGNEQPFNGSAPLMVVYYFKNSRTGACLAQRLNGYRCILQIDGYAAYDKLARSDGSTMMALNWLACWSRSRRKFYELHVRLELRDCNGDDPANGEALAG